MFTELKTENKGKTPGQLELQGKLFLQCIVSRKAATWQTLLISVAPGWADNPLSPRDNALLSMFMSNGRRERSQTAL